MNYSNINASWSKLLVVDAMYGSDGNAKNAKKLYDALEKLITDAEALQDDLMASTPQAGEACQCSGCDTTCEEDCCIAEDHIGIDDGTTWDLARVFSELLWTQRHIFAYIKDANKRFDLGDNKFDDIDTKFKQIDKAYAHSKDRIENEFSELKKKVDLLEARPPQIVRESYPYPIVTPYPKERPWWEGPYITWGDTTTPTPPVPKPQITCDNDVTKHPFSQKICENNNEVK